MDDENKILMLQEVRGLNQLIKSACLDKLSKKMAECGLDAYVEVDDCWNVVGVNVLTDDFAERVIKDHDEFIKTITKADEKDDVPTDAALLAIWLRDNRKDTDLEELAKFLFVMCGK